jgi:hypothetical protein
LPGAYDYRQSLILRRLAIMPVAPPVQEHIYRALTWAWNNVLMHAIHPRGTFLRLCRQGLRLISKDLHKIAEASNRKDFLAVFIQAANHQLLLRCSSLRHQRYEQGKPAPAQIAYAAEVNLRETHILYTLAITDTITPDESVILEKDGQPVAVLPRRGRQTAT